MIYRKFHFSIPLASANMPDLSEYMTVREAAKQLGFTVHGVRRLIKISKLDAVLVGSF